MLAKRPLLSKSGPQLQKLFESNLHDAKTLRVLLSELKHRSTPTAQALRSDVEDALNLLRASVEQVKLLTCAKCQTPLEVPASGVPTAYTCPTCESEFEVSLLGGGTLQVSWMESTTTGADEGAVTSETAAREILGVDPTADFATIKLAWRTATQQYDPSKNPNLPQRLRRAAELELQRINDAYRLLEGRTASDF